MKKLFISSLFIFIILAGCSNDDAYNNSIQKGLDYIASEEYQKAEGAFELALDEKKDDEKAMALLQQTVYYQDALKAIDEGELDSAKEKAEKIITIENGSAALIKNSEDIITSIEAFEAKLTEVTEEYEAALKLFEDNEYEEAEEKVGNILKTDLEQPIFKSIKKKIEELKKDIDLALAGDKKAAEEQPVKKDIDESNNQSEDKKDNALSEYTSEEIEYARVWLQVIGNHGTEELNVYHTSAGETVNNYEDNSVPYPKDTIDLVGKYTADGSVTYSGNGDGTINVYDLPSHWPSPDEIMQTYGQSIKEYTEDIMENPKIVHIDPGDDEKVEALIKKMNLNP